MPVRFQVDPDFYDHPKTTGMSDSAFSLWVRAGSFSAAKLTDGFISDDVLAHTLRTDAQVAEELVRRGLWRRRKGGFQFHQWEARNLLKVRVETDRMADRDRKRRGRKDGGQNGNPQVEAGIVRAESGRNPSGVHQDSERIPPVSVSVSVSESLEEPSSPTQRATVEDLDFARFWDVYPRKVGKGEARKVWARLRKSGVDVAAVIAGAERYRDDPHRRPEYTKHPGPWLNAERWTDQPAAMLGDDQPKGWWNN